MKTPRKDMLAWALVIWAGMGLVLFGNFASAGNATDVEATIKLAEQGDSTAQHNLGNMYLLGRGVKQDYKKAAGWFRKAAEQGKAQAQMLLGVAYYEGKGLDQNFIEAYVWFSIAAMQGDVTAGELRDTVFSKLTPEQNKKAQILVASYTINSAAKSCWDICPPESGKSCLWCGGDYKCVATNSECCSGHFSSQICDPNENCFHCSEGEPVCAEVGSTCCHLDKICRPGQSCQAVPGGFTCH